MKLVDVPRLANAADLELAARRIVEGLYAGRHRSPFTGSAVEFSDHRAYQPGDDLRAVDWKAFARSDHLLIRRYHEERDLPLVLVVDSSASMDYGDPSKAGWASTAAAALALLAVDQGDRVRLACGAATLDSISPEVGGAGGVSRLLLQLAAATPRGPSDLPRLLDDLARRLERRTVVVLISDLLVAPATLAVPLGALAARGHELSAIQILDRTEIELPAAWGLSALADPEGATAPLTCDAAAAKPGYDALMQNHLSACRALLASCRGDHLLASTAEHVADALGGWLRRRRKR